MVAVVVVIMMMVMLVMVMVVGVDGEDDVGKDGAKGRSIGYALELLVNPDEVDP